MSVVALQMLVAKRKALAEMHASINAATELAKARYRTQIAQLDGAAPARLGQGQGEGAGNIKEEEIWKAGWLAAQKGTQVPPTKMNVSISLFM